MKSFVADAILDEISMFFSSAFRKEKDGGKEERPENKSYHPSILTENVYLSHNHEVTLSITRRQTKQSLY